MNYAHTRTTPGGVFAVLVFACVLSAFLHGCGASALQRQTTAARITRAALDVTADGLEVACAVERVEDADDPAQRAQRCLRAAEGHDVAVAAWKTWISALVLAEGDDDAMARAIHMAAPILAFYQQTAELLRALGVNVPDLPPMLMSLARAQPAPSEPDETPPPIPAEDRGGAGVSDAGPSDAGVPGGTP